MRNRILFGLALVGMAAGLSVAYLFSLEAKPLPPVFTPASNPYRAGIYSEGIVESDQPSGENINVYPEVPGTVKEILASEGQTVSRGMPLVKIDDSIQSALVQQQQAQAEAAFSLLQELKAQPRKENLDIVEAQLVAARASLKTAEDTLAKEMGAFQLDNRSVSKDALDSSINAAALAKANLAVAQRQFDLTKAGAWVFDITNQERQYHALQRAHASSAALLAKYTLRAPSDGIVLSINTTVGSYVSASGSYESYTQGMNPVLVLGSPHTQLNVRCYVDEILVPRIPAPAAIKATMTVRGTNTSHTLSYVRVQPYVSPKIELSDQRNERVDVRVLPVIFKIENTVNENLYPGELVDVYIGQ